MSLAYKDLCSYAYCGELRIAALICAPSTEKLDFVLAEEDARGWKHFAAKARKDVLRLE